MERVRALMLSPSGPGQMVCFKRKIRDRWSKDLGNSLSYVTRPQSKINSPFGSGDLIPTGAPFSAVFLAVGARYLMCDNDGPEVANSLVPSVFSVGISHIALSHSVAIDPWALERCERKRPPFVQSKTTLRQGSTTKQSASK